MRGDEHTSYDGAAPAAAAPATRRETAPPSAAGAGTSAGPDVHAVLRSRGYVLLLVAAAVLALPLSAIAFGFLAGIQWLQQVVWQGLPHQLGYATPPAWLPLPVLALAGLAVGAAIRYLPGHGGHVPADGLAGGLTEPRSLPGVTLAALAGLSLGAVIGPEAPLIALGGGLALFAADRTKLGSDPQGRMLIALAGSAAAIATIFGNPLIAVILLLEVVAIANGTVMVAIVPCFVSGGVGAVLFTGLGSWTGLPIGTLALPDVGATTLDWVDLVSVVPLAAAVALLVHGAVRLGRRTAAHALTRPLLVPVVAGLATGALAGIYALATGRSPVEVLTSGQAAMPGLVDPHLAGRRAAAPAAVQGRCLRPVPRRVPGWADVPGDLPRRRRWGAGGPRARPRRRPGDGDLHGGRHGRGPAPPGDLRAPGGAAARAGGHQPDARGVGRDGHRARHGGGPRPPARHSRTTPRRPLPRRSPT